MSTKQKGEPMQNPHRKSDLFELWIRIMNKVIRSESLPRDFGTGDPLFTSEIHTLCVIGTAPGINITDLSVRLGVTKGAISKIAKKIEEKGLIERYQEPGNDKEVLLRLTPKGKKAYLGHENYHKKAFERITRAMETLTDEQTVFLFQAFESIEEMMDSTLLEKESIKRTDTTHEKTP
jgi:DNA-binding MarR family transcriptional regulator